MQWNEAHRRFNPLGNSWVLVSPHRLQRPWQGQQESVVEEARPPHDPKCYLCPGNKRAGDATNPSYKDTFVFENDFAAVKNANSIESSELSESIWELQGEEHNDDSLDDIFKAEQATGKCLVICFSPRHDLTLAQMDTQGILKVVQTWVEVYKGALEDPEINYCQIFENKGAAMGCSNPHPHGQVWMTNIVPEEPSTEHANLSRYEASHNGRGLLQDYVVRELKIHESYTNNPKKDRVIILNSSFVALVPFWATWPFEIMVISIRKVSSIDKLTDEEAHDLADILRQVTVTFDNLFNCSFPYSMGLHQAYTNKQSGPQVEHLHIHFYPPLLRSATVRKFLVGFEMLGMPQRDIPPELAASMLRNVSPDVHYRSNANDLSH